MKHKHYDMIVAWAGGAQIQCKQHGYEDCWADVGYSNWENPYCVYRIKPEPKPDVVKIFYLDNIESNLLLGLRFSEEINPITEKTKRIRCTFDGETCILKDVKMI